MYRALLVVAVCCASAVSAAFLDEYQDTPVVQLTPDNFQSLVAESGPSTIVLVQFYAPFSPNCKKLSPVWIEFAKQMEQEAL